MIRLAKAQYPQVGMYASEARARLLQHLGATEHVLIESDSGGSLWVLGASAVSLHQLGARLIDARADVLALPPETWHTAFEV